MAAPPSTSTEPALRRAILLHLRRIGAASPDTIASAVGASRSGVAQQLRALEGAGLVTKTAVRHGVGRPRHLYDVTPDAQGLFPSNYEGLAAGLIAAILELGGDPLLDDVMAARSRQAGAALRGGLEAALPADAPLVERVRELARLQDRLGYLAEAQVDDGAIRLVQHNCAVHDIASANDAACRAELEMFRGLLGKGVERECHIMGGDRCCTYRVTPADA
jgi:predicted ArsR family transcriptional regulator